MASCDLYGDRSLHQHVGKVRAFESVYHSSCASHQTGRNGQFSSNVHDPLFPTHSFNWIGPSMASITSSRVISPGGRTSVTPPRAPREVCKSPAIDSCEMILARKEGGIFCSSAMKLVAVRWSPVRARCRTARTA